MGTTLYRLLDFVSYPLLHCRLLCCIIMFNFARSHNTLAQPEQNYPPLKSRKSRGEWL